MLTGDTLDAVRAVIGADAVSDELVDCARLSHDASHYLLMPKAIVTPTAIDDVVALMRVASDRGLPLTFRSGGTSLSGQASSDGVLVDVRRHFATVEVLDDGRRVRCGAGAVLRQVNAQLAPYGRRLGPDPASESACTIGGVVANNSSGMTSGSTLTAYHTLESMVVVLPSGTKVDTARPDADDRLRHDEPELYRGLGRLRDRVRGDDRLRAIVAHQFSMKNTMGYSVNAFTDHARPVDILAHLVVGSEGTLAFVASVTLATVPVLPHAATSLLVFENLPEATDSIAALATAGARSIELMDAAALRVAQRDAQAGDVMRTIDVRDHTALLVEFQAATDDELDSVVRPAASAIERLPTTIPPELTRDPGARAAMWHVRKGLYAAVAAARAPGTTALLEDIVVPPQELTATMSDLAKILRRQGYGDAVTFGHAKDANLHFMISPDFGQPDARDRYARFTDDMVDLVLGRGGSLKAEHGTGRVMAPFVRRQYGDELYDVMLDVKRLCDRHGVLAPGVLLDDDAEAHLRHLKTVPQVDPEVDRCVECGYCEPVCPSRNVTTTPRQRIVLMRELAVATPRQRRQLEAGFDYQAVQTCAADSLCAGACPVDIDTGAVMKRMRARSARGFGPRIAMFAAKHWGATLAVLRLGVAVAQRVPSPVLTAASKVARAVLGTERVPELGRHLPAPGRKRAPRGYDAAAGVVFYPSCIGSLFGPEQHGRGAADAFVAVCERAGIAVRVPRKIAALCCGTPWESKGFPAGQDHMVAATADALWRASDSGRIPVVSESSSCTHGLTDADRLLRDRGLGGLRIIDAVTFVRETVLPRLAASGAIRRFPSVAVHPTCSLVHLRAVDDLVAVAASFADDVVVPTSWGCCGMAGDRGLLHPELTAAATAPETAEVALRRFDAYVSANRTCELAMTRSSGKPYRHVIELLDEALTAADGGSARATR